MIVNGVDLPDFRMIGLLCEKKMIQKAEEKGNTWRASQYLSDDKWLYEELIRHAQKVQPIDTKPVTEIKGAYAKHLARVAIEKTIFASIDVINFAAMITENAVTASDYGYIEYLR